MSASENVALIRRLSDEFWNRGNTGVLDELFADDFVNRNPAPGTEGTKESFRQFALALRGAFDDTRTTVDDVVAEDDKVAWRWTFRGKQTGALMGIPATGKDVSLTGITIDRVAGNQIVERWSYANTLGLLQQVGAVPGPTAAGPEASTSPFGASASTGNGTDADANKAVIRHYFDLLNAFDLDGVATLVAPGYELHFDSVPTLDTTGAIGFFGAFLTAFPDIQHEVIEQVAEGDRVATRIMVRGTHREPFMGMPPTGKAIAIGAINIQHLADGRIAEQWVISDGLGMMQQLGAVPTPAATGD